MLMEAHLATAMCMAVELVFVLNSKPENNKAKHQHASGEQGSRAARELFPCCAFVLKLEEQTTRLLIITRCPESYSVLKALCHFTCPEVSSWFSHLASVCSRVVASQRCPLTVFRHHRLITLFIIPNTCSWTMHLTSEQLHRAVIQSEKAVWGI